MEKIQTGKKFSIAPPIKSGRITRRKFVERQGRKTRSAVSAKGKRKINN